MILFDGKTLADQREAALKQKVAELKKLHPDLQITMAAILFAEDAGSVLYTRLKQEAAERVGITYQVHTFSLAMGVEEVMTKLRELGQDPIVTGVIIQKPSRQIWQAASRVEGEAIEIRQAFSAWWQLLTSQINEQQDVDGLHPKTLAAISSGSWVEEGRVMPATARAVLEILRQVPREDRSSDSEELVPQEEAFWAWLQTQKVAILGRSDLLGQPLFFLFKNHQVPVELLGTAELKRKQEQGKDLKDFTIVISATGRPNLVTGNLLANQLAAVIDVGEPQPDIDRTSVEPKTQFLTPVPGGVGPLTVVSLLENAVELVNPKLIH